MKLEQKTATHKIFKRNDGRYAVVSLKGQPVNGDEKVALLTELGLVSAPEKKAEPEAADESTATEEGSGEESAEAEATAK